MQKITFAMTTLLFSWLALAASAALADVTTHTIRDNVAYAQYYQYTDNCNGLSVDVFAGESFARTDNVRTFTPYLILQIVGYNSCTGEFFFMSGGTDQFTFTVLGNLAAAEVSGNVVVADEFGNTKHVSLALSWQGGVLRRDLFTYVSSTALSRTVLKNLSTLRFSDSITGSLVVDGVDLLSSSNVTYSSGISGLVAKVSGASIDIIRTR